MSTKKILYKTTSMGTSGTFSAKIRIANLTDGGAKEYKHPSKRTDTNLQENHLMIVAVIAHVSPESVELIASDTNGHYYVVTQEDES
jgi:hypothetical protein